VETVPCSINVLGVRLSALPMVEVLRTIVNWIETGERHYVTVATVHTLLECQQNPSMKSAVNGAGLITPDGMPLVWLLRRAGHRQQDRVYGPDLMLHLCELSQQKGFKHFFYGGVPGVPEKLRENLKTRFPYLTICGFYSPPFRPLLPEEDQQLTNMINQADPDVVWVGLGTPKQDIWMAENNQKLAAKVCIGVGAAFDFHAGRVKQAPRWMQRSGFEWAYRLWQEPRRLWRRYILGNPAFICLTALQLLGLRKYE
jgi:N-acetylglucosaminyldiphosphoundecaprenol N-acetyl-beta-D-mannosaminyltransferase